MGLRRKEGEENYVTMSIMLCVPCQILRIIRVIKIICDNAGGHVGHKGKVHRGLKPIGRLRKEITILSIGNNKIDLKEEG